MNRDERLHSIVSRIVNIETQRRELAEDVKEIKQEAKSAGYPPKAFALLLKQALETDKQRSEREEAEARLEEMKAAIGGIADLPLGVAALERAVA